MRRSSRQLEVFAEGRPVLEDGSGRVPESSGEGDDGLVVAFAFGALAVAEGAAVRAFERGEGGLVEDAPERLAATGCGSPASANIAQKRRAAPPGLSSAVRVLRASSPSIPPISAPMAAGSFWTAWRDSSRALRSIAPARRLATSIPMKTAIPRSVADLLQGTPPSPSSPCRAMHRAARSAVETGVGNGGRCHPSHRGQPA